MLKARPNQKIAISSMNKIGNTTAASAISDALFSRSSVQRARENSGLMRSKRYPWLAGSIKQDCNGCGNAKRDFRGFGIVNGEVLAGKVKTEKRCRHAAEVAKSLS